MSWLLCAGMAHGPILNALSNPTVSLGLGSVALLGPGRPLIKDGLLSLIRQAILRLRKFASQKRENVVVRLHAFSLLSMKADAWMQGNFHYDFLTGLGASHITLNYSYLHEVQKIQCCNVMVSVCLE